MNYSWNWGVLFESPYFEWLMSGAQLTVAISLSAWLLALSLGTAVGLIGSLPHRIARFIAGSYISLFRNIPFLLQLFLWFFVVPEIVPTSWGHLLKRELPHPEIWTSIVALGLFTASRVAVQVSAGVRAVPAGQRNAAMASGLGLVQSYRYVLLPQAFRIVLPPLTSEFLTTFKNSSIALTIGVFELTARTQQIESYTFQGFEAFTAATTIYIAIALAVTFGMRALERRVATPGTARSG